MAHKQLLCYIIVFWSLTGSTQVVTSFPVLTFIAQEIANSKLSVETILSNSTDAHHFDLSPKVIVDLKKEKLIIYNGLGLDPWIQKLKINTNLNLKFIEASKGIPIILKDSKNLIDPHAWHHPDNLEKYIENISSGLQENFPKQKSLFKLNTEKLIESLRKWKAAKLKEIIKKPKSIILITAHGGFNYLALFFQLQSIALLGNEEGETLTPKQMTLNLNEIKKYNLKLFFGDNEEIKDQFLKNWLKKTNGYWSGSLWGESIDPNKKSISILDYLNHNASLILESIKTNTR